MLTNIHEKLLIGLVRRNDSEAFAEIYNKYVKDIFRYIFFRVPTKDVAQDLTHDVWTNLLQYIKNSNRDREIENLRALIYHLARNSIANYYKRENVTIVPLTEAGKEGEVVETEMGKEIDLGEQIDKETLAAKIFDYIAEIKNEDYRQIIQLRFVENKDFKEIAEIMEKEASTLRVVLHRAMQQLKKKILESEKAKQ